MSATALPGARYSFVGLLQRQASSFQSRRKVTKPTAELRRVSSIKYITLEHNGRSGGHESATAKVAPAPVSIVDSRGGKADDLEG